MALNRLEVTPETEWPRVVIEKEREENIMSEKTIRALGRSPDEQHKLEQIQNVIDLFGRDRDNLIQILHTAQQIYGFLPLSVQAFIAEEMDLPVSEVAGVVTFYSFFSTKPRGEHIIRVCMGTACYVRGGKKIVEALQTMLNITLGETTSNGKFSLEVARCIGACGLAPAMMIDDTVYRQVNPNKLESILNKYR